MFEHVDGWYMTLEGGIGFYLLYKHYNEFIK